MTEESGERLAPLLYRIALLPGDGIGPEVTAEAQRLLTAIAQLDASLSFEVDVLPWNADHYVAHRSMMPRDGLRILEEYDAIFLGAVGDSRVPDHIALRQLIFAIRQGFDQYVNLRPVRLLRGVQSTLVGRSVADIDMIFVRENCEGEYSGVGSIDYPGTPEEVARQTSVFTRKGVERVMHFAFQLAQRLHRTLQSVSKGNALNYSGVLWDRIFDEVRVQYPDVVAESLLVDAAAFHMVRTPERFGVVVASNLFGDILTDLGAALAGGLGFAASANLCPTKEFPSMFEPVHGSAPDIAGRQVANPIATLWAVGMMLTDFGYPHWEQRIIEAIESVLLEGVVATPDLGGVARTDEVTSAVIATLRANAGPTT